MEWDVSEVKTIAPLALRVQFSDRTVGKVQFEQSHLKGVFEALKDPIFLASPYRRRSRGLAR
jgi:hypothetical protein